MEKYTNAKTIGDGTYGSVLKAVNSETGKPKNSTFEFADIARLAALLQERS